MCEWWREWKNACLAGQVGSGEAEGRKVREENASSKFNH